MKFVVDTNVLIAYFWEHSTTRKILQHPKLQLFTTGYSFVEIENHSEHILKNAKITRDIFKKNVEELKSIVTIVQIEEYQTSFSKAKMITPDKNDIEFIALALSMSISLWTNDEELKQQEEVDIITTREVIEILF